MIVDDISVVNMVMLKMFDEYARKDIVVLTKVELYGSNHKRPDKLIYIWRVIQWIRGVFWKKQIFFFLINVNSALFKIGLYQQLF